MFRKIEFWTSNKFVKSGSAFIGFSFAANLLNYLFNFYLGKHLNFEDFGTITFLNALTYILNFFLLALMSVTTREVAYISSKKSISHAVYIFFKVREKFIGLSCIVFILFLLSAARLSEIFRLDNNFVLLLLSPIIISSTFAFLYRGYLRGTFRFAILGLTMIMEPTIRLIAAIIFIVTGLEEFVFLSIPLSIIFTSFLTVLYVNYLILTEEKNKIEQNYKWKFPVGLYSVSFLTGFASTSFLTVDIILVKFYFSPQVAGAYALLSLIGKAIYFFASILNNFISPISSKAYATKKDVKKEFYLLLSGTVFLALTSALLITIFGKYLLPIVLGKKALEIVEYLGFYSFGISLFTIIGSFISYHIPRKEYSFALSSVLASIILIFGIVFNHGTLDAIVKTIFISASIGLTISVALHVIREYGVYIIRFCIDLLDLILFTQQSEGNDPKIKRILIFNWRDTKHIYAGGAEEYLHQLAARWVKKGNTVTWFCGNDGKSKRYEVIDGIKIIRRGGFYFVYFWAFLYYIFRFKNKYDIVIDSENGIPFFTPLYVKEKIYLVMHHVHREVFFKYLIPPFSWFAAWLELKVMPWAYKNVQFITVSESTKREIFENHLTDKEPLLVHNGVDISKYSPGEKSSNPIVLYLGRLKQYKSVDVLIKSAKQVIEKIPEAEFIIAGDGEEKIKLMGLTKKLKLELKIKFLGKVTDDQKLDLYRKAWVLVHPSMMEGWGINIIEANACGTPVVAADVPGLRDSVKNPHTGYLLKHGDCDAFAEKISFLLSNTTVRKRMSEYSVFWAKKYTWDESADKLLKQFYNENTTA